MYSTSKFWELQTPGALMACPVFQWNSFKFALLSIHGAHLTWDYSDL